MAMRGLLLLSLLSPSMSAKTIYCFTCVTPNSYEVGMIAGMAKLGLGLFECNGWDIISNVSAEALFAEYPEVLPIVKGHVWPIDINLFVKKVKGPIGHDISSPATDPTSPLYQGKDATMEHLANTPVFKEVWNKIFSLNHFGGYDYTAKLDVDAVIVPARLSGMLGARPDVAEYFQNALHDMYGNFLHGPIELISKKGVYAFRDARGVCFNKIDQMAFGEDFFAKQCWDMIKIHGVPTMEVRLMYDDYEWGRSAKHRCDALNPDPMVFKAPQYFAVYHPRKSMKTWIQCRKETGVPGIPPQGQLDAAIRLAGPGKPYDMKPVRLYDSAMTVLEGHGLSLLLLVAGVVTLLGLWVSRRRHTQRALVQSIEEGLVEDIE